jgi:hypothetical protein
MKITLRLSTQKQETTDMGFNLDDYEPVAARLDRWLTAKLQGFVDSLNDFPRVTTTMVSEPGADICVMRAQLWLGDMRIATGYAEEVRGSGNVNRTSHVENCETSAIGRALANAGYAGSDMTKRPSREEMTKVANSKPARTPLTNVKRVASISQNGIRTFEDGTIQAPPDLLGVAIKGKQHGPLPEWFLQDAFAAGVVECWDNRDKVAGTKRPWFKDAHGDKAFWPPKGTPDPQLEVETYDDSPEEPF